MTDDNIVNLICGAVVVLGLLAGVMASIYTGGFSNAFQHLVTFDGPIQQSRNIH